MCREPLVRIDEDLDGRYSNYFQVGHNSLEFLVDFGRLHGHLDSVRIHTRIIVSPAYAKALLGVLADAVGQYEERNGAITCP